MSNHNNDNTTIQTANYASTTVTTATSTSTITSFFKSSSSLQTKKPAPARSIADTLPEATYNPSEARYWTEKFGFGHKSSSGNKTRPTFAHVRKLDLKPSSSAIIHALTFGPPPASSSSKISPLAVSAGPRVVIYGTSVESPFHRYLAGRHSSQSTATGEKKNADSVPADRQIPTAGSLALCAQYRHDGRLLAVATDQGQVRVADATSRAVLCTFNMTGTGSTTAAGTARLPVRTVCWFRDGQHLLAAGDDGMARVMQLASSSATTSQSSFLELKGHGDAIRCATLWQASPKQVTKWPHKALGITGSYDHTIRIWNLNDQVDVLDVNGDKEAAGKDDMNDNNETDRCLSVLQHGSPVEALLLMPTSSSNVVPAWLLSAGGQQIKVWNIFTGACVCELDAQHRKTITSLLAMPRENRSNNQDETSSIEMRILSGGLDGHIQVHDWNSTTGTLQHLHAITLPGGVGITALAVNEAADRLAIGTVQGTVLVRQRGPSIVPKRKTARQAQPRAGTYAYFTRGMNANVVAGDYVVEEQERKRKLRKFDVSLRSFRYGDALDEALASRRPEAVVAVLEELGKRGGGGLKIALSNRDEESLEPLLSFMVRYIANPKFAALLVGVTHALLDIYEDIAGESEVIDELFEKLRQQVTLECKAQQQLLELVGQLDAVIAADSF